MSDIPSNKPYLIRALHQWCTDFGFTPFIAVFVDARVEVPMEFVKNDEIVLNLSLEASRERFKTISSFFTNSIGTSTLASTKTAIKGVKPKSVHH